MPVPDPTNPDTAVRVQPGDTLSGIAKANGLTLSEIRDLNPTLMSNPKYNNGNTIFSNTKINIAPATSSVSSSYSSAESLGLSDRAIDERASAAAAAKASQDSMAKALADQAAKEAADQAAEEARRLAAEEEARRLALLNKKETFITSYGSSAISPTPSIPSYAPAPTPPPPPIKTAAPDIILFDNESVPIEVMSDLIFENIGGQELINIVRNDTINGQQVMYQPIKNLSILQRLYNSNNLLNLQQTSEKYFQNFSIKLEERLPTVGSGPNGETLYIDQETGDLVIDFINILDGEQIECQVSTSGTIYEGSV
jgi:murein DD-endopeptidase MepM/ murein hydrolase activator NlpD